MNYFLGIDGGGSKTAFLLSTSDGLLVANAELSGSSYQQCGIDGVVKVFTDGITICANAASIKINDITSIAIGLPCYGENITIDKNLIKEISKAFKSNNIYITNDVEVGWAGSLAMQPGINIVSGTGSIAYGKDQKGNSARCGGWNDFFSDEGSCYWLGRKTMELFSKQSDFREPRGALYGIIRNEFNITNDYEFIEIMLKEYIPDRTKVAKMQIFLNEAAYQGDRSAINIYKLAINELVKLAEGVKSQLSFDKKITVSYSGGLFKAKSFDFNYFTNLLNTEYYVLKKPILSPACGALLLAAYKFSKNDFEQFKQSIIQSSKNGGIECT